MGCDEGEESLVDVRLDVYIELERGGGGGGGRNRRVVLVLTSLCLRGCPF